MATKYLYGAAAQGIQQFIFQTNKLREIVGASELVEKICTDLFERIIKQEAPSANYEKGIILRAAGNIKFVFEDENECKKIVRIFPKEASLFAPGITFSQAVVKYEEGKDQFSNVVNKLEGLLRAQRNCQMRNQTIGLMGIKRSGQTNLPVVKHMTSESSEDNEMEVDEEERVLYEYMDAATFAKLYEKNESGVNKRRTTLTLSRTAFRDPKLGGDKVAYNINSITEKNDWIAIIHADGNGLGQVVQKIGTDKDKFKKFSEALDNATKEAAQDAYDYICYAYEWKNKRIPIRPIVLGGDDFTVICRADLALEYVTEFIRNFENKTTKIAQLEDVFADGVKKLTACAGIAYIKSSYPFYYGYELAEQLCSRAKKDAKAGLKEIGGKMQIAPSCLMFHKVEDSFTEDYSDIVARELKPQKDITFEYGPYYLEEEKAKEKGKWTIEKLLEQVRFFQKPDKEVGAVKSHLRQWMSYLHGNTEMAKQKLDRIIEVSKFSKTIMTVTGEVDGNKGRTPVYDILALNTVGTQETEKKKK